VERGATVLRALPTLVAVLRTGISPTILQGGVRSNVIPSDAVATLNIRTLPGLSIDDVVARLTRAVNDPLVRIEVTSRGKDSPPMSAANEFYAYAEMSRSLTAEPMSERATVITAYALCGFANFSSIAIQIGGIGGIAPERKSDLARLGMRAMIAGTLACFQTATIAGLLS